MARERVALKHPIKRGVDLVFGNFPRHQRALSQIRREQSLPDTPDCLCAQHRSDAGHHNLDIYTRAPGNLFKRLANKSFNLVFGNGEDFRVYWIVVLYGQHTN